MCLPASETMHFSMMEQLTHLDLRMNNIKELDLRCVKSLEYLNVERNNIHTLQLNGTVLKTVFAAHNGELVTSAPGHISPQCFLIEISKQILPTVESITLNCSRYPHCDIDILS